MNHLKNTMNNAMNKNVDMVTNTNKYDARCNDGNDNEGANSNGPAALSGGVSHSPLQSQSQSNNGNLNADSNTQANANVNANTNAIKHESENRWTTQHQNDIPATPIPTVTSMKQHAPLSAPASVSIGNIYTNSTNTTTTTTSPTALNMNMVASPAAPTVASGVGMNASPDANTNTNATIGVNVNVNNNTKDQLDKKTNADISAAASKKNPWTMGATSTDVPTATTTTPTPTTTNIATSAAANDTKQKSNAQLDSKMELSKQVENMRIDQQNNNPDRPISGASSHSQYNPNAKVEIGMKVRETPSPLSTPSMSPSPSNPQNLPNIPLLSSQNQQQSQCQAPIQQQQIQEQHAKSKYEERLSNLGVTQPSEPVEFVLAAACESLGFDIVEMWLRTGPKTHQLIHSHLRYTALDDTTRSALVDVYYGENAPSRCHKLSPALCKKARANNDVVWVTSQTYYGAQALRCSLNGVKSAVAVPVCHEESHTNITVIYFSVKRAVMQPVASEFLIHMSLAAAIVSVNTFNDDYIVQEDELDQEVLGNDVSNTNIFPSYHDQNDRFKMARRANSSRSIPASLRSQSSGPDNDAISVNSVVERLNDRADIRAELSKNMQMRQEMPSTPSPATTATGSTAVVLDSSRGSRGVQSVVTLPADVHHRMAAARPTTAPSSVSAQLNVPPNITTDKSNNDDNAHASHIYQEQQMRLQLQQVAGGPVSYSVSGACLNLRWSSLSNVEYLTDGGNNWIHTAVLGSQPVVIKQLKPEVQDVVNAMDEIESELSIHANLEHRNIVSLYGAGYDRKGCRFIVMERLDGGTLTQVLGYDTRIRDRRRRFFVGHSKKNKLPYVKVLKYAQQIATAMDYLHRSALDGSMILHRDLKPDNIGFTLDGTLKVMDFGLSTIVPNSSPHSDEIYELSGETGSLRYMAPEVASRSPYNHKADVYSFGIMLWELITFRKPFEKMNREEYYEKVVYGGHRPEISKKFPHDLAKLIRDCWDIDPQERPSFQSLVLALADMLGNEISKNSKGHPKGSRDQKGGGNGGGSRVSKFVKKLAPARHSTWF